MLSGAVLAPHSAFNQRQHVLLLRQHMETAYEAMPGHACYLEHRSALSRLHGVAVNQTALIKLVGNWLSRSRDFACTHLLTPLKRLLRLLPELQPRRALSWAALLSEDLPDNPDSWAASGWLLVRSRLPLPPSLLSPAAP